MALTNTITVPDELKNLSKKSLELRDRFILGAVQGHRREPSKNEKRLLKRVAIVNSPMEGRGSLFRYLKPLWQELTTEQKALWTTAGLISGLSNWQLFISDNAERIKNSLTTGVAPSNLWQVRAGRLLIQAPANVLILRQDHPQSYYIARKIVGSSYKNELVKLQENFGFPLTIGIRYKSNLVANGPVHVARYFARVWTSYQGEDIFTDYPINFTLVTDWTYSELEITGTRGIIIGYTLFLDIIGYRGELLYDNIRAVHGGTNWALDPRCDNISKIFTKGFALVPPFWIPVSAPTGAQYFSAYPPAL